VSFLEREKILLPDTKDAIAHLIAKEVQENVSFLEKEKIHLPDTKDAKAHLIGKEIVLQKFSAKKSFQKKKDYKNYKKCN